GRRALLAVTSVSQRLPRIAPPAPRRRARLIQPIVVSRFPAKELMALASAWTMPHDAISSRTEGATHEHAGHADALRIQQLANARILEAASGISEEQSLSPGAFARGGLRGTLVHTLFAEWVWCMRWRGAPPDVRWEPEEFPTFASLRARWL